jgi:hypothetical protein
MADIVITAANVVKGSNARTEDGIAGATITAGQVVYKDDTTAKYLLADSNSATADARQGVGIALNGAALNQPIEVVTGGDVTVGGTLTAGVAYYLSDTPGGICAVADVGAAEYVCLLGLAKSTTVLAVDIQFPNVAL